ncbi:hypothetical protein ACFSRY_09550 [Pontibacter locisalis]|uniref:Uncharacterized protein n=1 Tax=Pontibacter locisalis TaxID=1719035 RepID=A0ABW5IKC8_9BACT
MITGQIYLPWLIGGVIVLLLFWLAWRRPNRQRLVWRLLASAVAGISLVLLVFPPAVQQAISPSTAVLLTEGFNSDSLDALLQKLEAKPQLYTYKTSSANNAVAVPSLHTLRQQQPGLQKLHLFGYGLYKEELQMLDRIKIVPHLSAAPAEVQAVTWTPNMHLGEAIEVTGKAFPGNEEKMMLYLYAAGRAQDSVEVTPDSTQTFQLSYTPKATGRYTYTLLTKQQGRLDSLGQLPLEVLPPKQLGVLLLASAPNFEFKFLKNHLGELHHRVAMQTTVSKGISQSEWLNMPRINLSRISPKLLKNFDVVVVEPEALQNLSSTERAVLQKAVTEDGLGILTIATAPLNSRHTAFFTGFQTKRLSQQDTRNVRASWAGKSYTATAAPYTLINTTAVNSLVQEQKNNLLVGVKRAGWGKVAMSYVPQTFAWHLEGKSEIYASYWANLLTGIAKEQVQEKFWKVDQPQVPQPDKPVVLTFTDYASDVSSTIPDAAVVRLADSARVNLALAQNTHQPEQFSGTFWPGRSGWFQVQTTDSEPHYFYVHESTDWPHTGIQVRQRATQEYIAKQAIEPSSGTVAYKKEPVSLIWFFVLFVLSSSYLWLEEKF